MCVKILSILCVQNYRLFTRKLCFNINFTDIHVFIFTYFSSNYFNFLCDLIKIFLEHYHRIIYRNFTFLTSILQIFHFTLNLVFLYTYRDNYYKSCVLVTFHFIIEKMYHFHEFLKIIKQLTLISFLTKHPTKFFLEMY